MMIIVTNDSDYAIADGAIEEWFHGVLLSVEASSEEIWIATECQWNRLRQANIEGELKIDGFMFKGQMYDLNEFSIPTLDGESHWPNGLFDANVECIEKILMKGIEIRKKQREEKDDSAD